MDSASPSRRRSLPASPGVEQWAGEASSMKFLVREVEMTRGGRRMLMTVCSSRKISGCSRWGLSAEGDDAQHTDSLSREEKLFQ